MAILEALAAAGPASSPRLHFPDLAEADGGIVVEPTERPRPRAPVPPGPVAGEREGLAVAGRRWSSRGTPGTAGRAAGDGLTWVASGGPAPDAVEMAGEF
jgi:hypothetical protein